MLSYDGDAAPVNADDSIRRTTRWRTPPGYGTMPARRCAMKELLCSDLMPGCNFRAEGQNEDEVMKKAVEHARKDHGMAQIPPEVATKAQAAIRTK
jgi:predicted small metal-binding protein